MQRRAADVQLARHVQLPPLLHRRPDLARRRVDAGHGRGVAGPEAHGQRRGGGRDVRLPLRAHPVLRALGRRDRRPLRSPARAARHAVAGVGARDRVVADRDHRRRAGVDAVRGRVRARSRGRGRRARAPGVRRGDGRTREGRERGRAQQRGDELGADHRPRARRHPHHDGRHRVGVLRERGVVPRGRGRARRDAQARAAPVPPPDQAAGSARRPRLRVVARGDPHDDHAPRGGRPPRVQLPDLPHAHGARHVPRRRGAGRACSWRSSASAR